MVKEITWTRRRRRTPQSTQKSMELSKQATICFIFLYTFFLYILKCNETTNNICKVLRCGKLPEALSPFLKHSSSKKMTFSFSMLNWTELSWNVFKEAILQQHNDNAKLLSPEEKFRNATTRHDRRCWAVQKFFQNINF